MECCGVRMEGYDWEGSDKDMDKAQEHLTKHVDAIFKRLNLYSKKHSIFGHEA